MQYLLDTNAVSDLIRRPQGLVMQRYALVERGAVCTSIIVAAELRFGAVRHGSARLLDRLVELLEIIPAQPFETPADQTYASVRADLEKSGTPISNNDLLIAAHALTLDCTVVTDNEREFRRVPGLRVENWLRAV